MPRNAWCTCCSVLKTSTLEWRSSNNSSFKRAADEFLRASSRFDDTIRSVRSRNGPRTRHSRTPSIALIGTPKVARGGGEFEPFERLFWYRFQQLWLGVLLA